MKMQPGSEASEAAFKELSGFSEQLTGSRDYLDPAGPPG